MTIWNPDIAQFEGPRYRAIADAIEGDIKSGRIPSGFQLPTHRELADQLGVTVGTVTRGYAEAARRGLLRGETGRGTYVGGVAKRDAYFEHHEDNSKEAVDMGMTVPLSHLDPDVASTFSQLAEQPDIQSALRYFPSKGRHSDRVLGAEWLRNKSSLDVSEEAVLITAGGQHSLTIILSSAFRAGDTLAVESITYPLIKTLARRFNLRLFPIETDEEGMIPEALEQACERNKIHGIYCMPTTQNPTSARMSDARRDNIAAVADKHNLLILEDDAYALLSDEPFRPLTSRCPDKGFYIASFSKPVTAGLRFGYLAAPEAYYQRLEYAIADTLWMASPMSARIAREWIENGVADQTIKLKKAESKARNILTRECLKDYQLRWTPNGYFVWLQLPEVWTASDFAKRASEKQVIVTAMEQYLVGKNRPDPEFVRIAISGPDKMEQLQHGLSIIRSLLEESVY